MSWKSNGELKQQIQSVLKVKVQRIDSLSGGSVAQVFQVSLDDGSLIVAKEDRHSEGTLSLEASMLRFLDENSRLPVPAVLYDDDQLLLLEFVDGANVFSTAAQRHAAELMAELHAVSAQAYGFDWDTLIGGLHQPNPWTDSWLEFFAEYRLRYMGRQAMEAGRLPRTIFRRLEAFCGQLDRWLNEPAYPALIHGDAWTGNILATADRVTGFVDPAIYYADPEIELAFTTLFGTFSDAFFERYQEIRPIEPGFIDERRPIYNLYPLLVHVRLFGGSYVESVSQTLDRFGF